MDPLPNTVFGKASPNSGAETNVSLSQNSPATTVTHGVGLLKWPTKTEIYFLSGSNKMMLTSQCPIIHAVIQDAIERTHASLMFSNVFLDLFGTLEYLQEALVEAAKRNKEAPDIYRRLLSDHLYCVNMSRIVSRYILITKVADILSSLMHTFPFSTRKSRTAVLQSYRPNSWPFRLSWGSCAWPKNNCCLIITHFQEQAR